MSYYGDFNSGSLVSVPFNTSVFPGGFFSLVSGIAAVYKTNSDTESVDGVSLDLDIDGRIGYHQVLIDTSDLFYESNKDFSVILTSGYVGGISISNSLVGSFSIENRFATPASGGVTAEEINEFLSDVHGSGLWTTSGCCPTGTLLVTVNAQDENLNPIGGAVVEVRASGFSNLTGLSTTDMSQGSVLFNLDAGFYDFYAYKPGSTQWTNPHSQEITGDTTITLIGSNINDCECSATPPSGLIKIYACLRDLGMTQYEGAEMIVEPSGCDFTYNNATVFVKKNLTSISDASGCVSINITPGGSGFYGGVKVSIPKACFERYFIPPESGSVNVLDL